MKVNLFLIGAMRSGSTTLYNYLKQHPEIYMSKVKEPYFFTAEYYRYFLKKKKYKNYNEKQKAENFLQSGRYRTKESYDSLFKNAQGFKYIGEASHYIHHPKTAKLIYQYNPNSKIIMTIRNPIDRVYSEYMFRIRKGQINISFYDFLMSGLKWENNSWTVLGGNGIPKGFYAHLLKPWIEIFGIENIKICLFEDLIKKPTQTCSDIFSWLRINTNFKPVILHAERSGKPRSVLIAKILQAKNPIYLLLKKSLPSYRRIQLRDYLNKIILKSENMEKETRKILKSIYNDDILSLQSIIKKELSHWQ